MSDRDGARPGDDRLEHELDALRRGFSERLPGRLGRMTEEWKRLRTSDWPETEARAFHRSVHGLAGTSGSLGFVTVGDLVREAEQVVDGLLRAGRAPDADDYDHVLDLLAAASEASTRQPSDVAAPGPGRSAAVAEDRTAPLLVVIIDPDRERARVLGAQLEHFGYRVEISQSVEAFTESTGGEGPGAVVCDLGPADTDLRVASHLQRLRDSGQLEATVLFVSSRGDIEARLAAVRAGCAAFFTRPVNPGSVVQALDRLTRRVPSPYRVLIVDDEPDAARYHALVLERGGFLTRTVLDPLEVSAQLVEFRPDLILMDVYMPTCSGVELATVIRQQEAFIGIPIVYLSAERDRIRQIDAMGRGGDDFFTKPVDPEQLVSLAVVRSQRGRILRASLERDGLTGLLNHSRMVEQLEVEVRRVSRTGSPLTLAMLDIDRFKQVNDRWGHLAGDQVLKSLSFLLRQRLRLSDQVGRFGGDEFTVLLPDTGREAATRLMGEVCRHVAALDHVTHRGNFRVTISCGVAEHAPVETSQDLISRADAALYAAKRGGGNRVESVGTT
jgi:diguanylate cyclase (GGDEF)-like protein